MLLFGLRRLPKAEPLNIKETRQRVARKLIEANKYCS